MYPLAVSALSYVPFVSELRRAPLSSCPFQVFELSHVPSGPRRGTSVSNFHFLWGYGPLEASRLRFSTENLTFAAPSPTNNHFLKQVGPWRLEAPGFL